MVNILCAFAGCHLHLPELKDSSYEFIFCQGLYCSCNEVLEFSPNMLYGIKIGTAGRRWPPIDPLFHIESLGNAAGMLRIIILHNVILSAMEVLVKEG